VLLGVAIVTSQFAARVRVQADLAASSARQNAALASFSRQLTASATKEELMQAICADIARLLEVRTALLLPGASGPDLRAAFPPEDRLGQIELAAAQWAVDNDQPAGRGSSTLTASDWLFHPLRTSRGVLGVLGLAREDAGEPVRSDQLPC
jgi:two-component system sensor histidine kinase KdpD